MKREKYFQYTKGWHSILIGTPFNDYGIIKWCDENGTTGKYHPVYNSHFNWGGDPGKMRIIGYLYMIKFSLLDDLNEFILVGDWRLE
jgi:hypothetical protein